MYKTAEDAHAGALPVHSVSLKGCEVTPDVNISQNKFGIKLEVPSSDGMAEMCIRCENVRTTFRYTIAIDTTLDSNEPIELLSEISSNTPANKRKTTTYGGGLPFP